MKRLLPPRLLPQYDYCATSLSAATRQEILRRNLLITEDTFLATDVAGRKKQSTLKDSFKWDVELCLCKDKSGRWSLNYIDDFPQLLLLLLNFKVLNWKCSRNLCPDCQRVTLFFSCQRVYSIKWIKVMISTCSIDFLVVLNYPSITNMDLRYNAGPAITNIFFGTVALRYSGVPLFKYGVWGRLAFCSRNSRNLWESFCSQAFSHDFSGVCPT